MHNVKSMFSCNGLFQIKIQNRLLLLVTSTVEIINMEGVGCGRCLLIVHAGNLYGCTLSAVGVLDFYLEQPIDVVLDLLWDAQ